MTTCSQPSSSDEPSQRDFNLAELYDSDKDVEDLLAEGADVSTLIEAGVLEDSDQPEELEATESEANKSSEEQIFYTDEEAEAVLEENRQLLNQFSRGSANAASQPN